MKTRYVRHVQSQKNVSLAKEVRLTLPKTSGEVLRDQRRNVFQVTAVKKICMLCGIASTTINIKPTKECNNKKACAFRKKHRNTIKVYCKFCTTFHRVDSHLFDEHLNFLRRKG